MADYTGMSVADILMLKKGTIKDAALEPGSPSWDEIMYLTWEEVDARAKRRDPGFRTFYKLLKRKRYDK